MDGFYARVSFQYDANNSDELSAKDGDVIKVINIVNEHWYSVQLNGKTGLFPVSYTAKIKNPIQHEIFVASESYQAAGPKELSFLRGEHVTVIEELDSNWCLGEVDGRIGIFPSFYVEKLYDSICSEEDDNHVFHSNVPNVQSCVSVEALYSFTARNQEELSFPEGAIINIIKDIDDDWYEGLFEGKAGLFPKSYVQAYHDIYEVLPHPCARSIYPFVGDNESELTFKEGEIILLRKRAGSQWLEGEIDGVVGLFPASFVDIEIDLPPDESKSQSLNQKVTLREGMKMKALYHFSALHPGDLALDEGDIVTIVTVVDDNWVEGRDKSGSSGMCPSAYLMLTDQDSLSSTNETNSYEGSICKQIKEGILASDTQCNTSPSCSSHSPSEWNSGFRQESNTDSGFFKTNFNKTNAAPKRPQSQSDDCLNVDGIDNNLSQSYPVQNKVTFTAANKSSIYAITFKHSQNKVSEFRGKSQSEKVGPRRLSSDEDSNAANGKSLIDMSVSHRASSFNLASPLVPLPAKPSSTGDIIEEPIVPKRKAPPPPRKTTSDASLPTAPTSPNKTITRSPPPRKPVSDTSLPNDKTKPDTQLSPKKIMGNSPIPPRKTMSDIPLTREKSTTLPPKKTKSDAPPPPRKTLSDQRALNMPRASVQGRDLALNDKSSERYGSSSSIGSGGSSSSDRSCSLKPASLLETSHKKRPPPPPARYNKNRTNSSTRSATIPAISPDSYKQDKATQKPARPYSVYYVGEDTKDDLNTHKSNNSQEDIRHANSELSQDEQDSLNCIDEIHVVLIPGVLELDKRIENAEHNLQVEGRACTGMKTILQMLVHDTDKHREMEEKISRSQQKIEEWKDIANGLKNERKYLIQSYPKRKRMEESLALLEADLQKQLRSQQSLQVLLNIVEDSRRQEVQENLSVCDGIIDDLQANISERKESLQNLNQQKSSKSTQKQFAEQREKVVSELISTEKDYLRDLELCLKYFAEELKNSKVVESDVLFGNMGSIVETSNKLLANFDKAVKEKDADKQELGKCFVDMADEIKDVYGQYCRNHDDAIGLLEKYEDIPEAQEVFNKCLNAVRDSTKCWDLSSFLIKPVQRVLKYPLLLGELLKCTPEIHRDKQNLIKAMTAMNEVATEINEVKRRKDIVLKYKRVEESGISKTFQKLNWHSVLKKSSRFNQRITQMTGLVAQTIDKKFNEQEKIFTSLEKAVKNLIKNITVYVEQFQETRNLQCINGDNIQNFYQDAATCTEVTLYQSTLKRINNDLFESFMNDVQRLVLSPLTSLLALFQGPQRLIQKRQDKCLDYDSKSNRIEKIKDKDKLKTAKSELESAKKDYEALNTQLLEELPIFHDQIVSLVKDCILNLMQAKRKFHAVFLGEYTNLMLLPMVKDKGDVIEQQTRKTQQVVEQMADLSFIPGHFLGKELLQKRREARRQPLIPSLPASTGDVISGQKKSASRGGSLSRKRRAPQPTPRSSTSTVHSNQEPPKPTPRRHTLTSPLLPQSSFEITASNFEPYVAISTFQAQNPGEVTLNEGDLVTVQRQSDSSGNSEWWLISCSGISGYVPSSFLEKYSEYEDNDNDESDDDPEGEAIDNCFSRKAMSYYAQFEFEGTSPVELSLDEGQVVKVLKFHDKKGNDEWWLVEAGGKMGYVASNFLAPVDDD